MPFWAANLRAVSISPLERRIQTGERSACFLTCLFFLRRTMTVPAFIRRTNSCSIRLLWLSCQAASSASDEKLGITSFLAMYLPHGAEVELPQVLPCIPRGDRTDFLAAVGENQD